MGGALLHMVAREGSSIKVTLTEVGELIRCGYRGRVLNLESDTV